MFNSRTTRLLKRYDKRILNNNFKILNKCMCLINLIDKPHDDSQIELLKQAVNTFEETSAKMISLAKKRIQMTEGVDNNDDSK